MKKIKLSGLVILCLAALSTSSQNKNAILNGSWKGELTTPSGMLEVVMNFKTSGEALAATMDVPAQMARNIAASSVTFLHDSVVVEFQALMGRYAGFYKRDSSLFTGEWEQNSLVLPLRLVPAKPAAMIKHPQEPVKPYAYNEEEVTFENEKDGIRLAGTFTWPKNKTHCPAVVLISGSGPQNRNEELMGQKPFLVLADALTKQGIAVLRFDDRGVGKSTGDFKAATTFDFSNDAEAALRYLKTRKEIDSKKTGLIGHSEGGMLAPMLAARSKDVAFVVLLAGPGIKGRELLLLQAEELARASGVAEEQLAKNKLTNKKIYTLALQNTAAANDSIVAVLEEQGMPDEQINKQLRSLSSPWFRYLLVFDPELYLSKTTCPVLALNGKKDVQVPYKENLAGIERDLAEAKNKQVTVKAYEGLNHLFQHCSSGLPNEYERIEETMSPEVLKDISDWILKTERM